MCILFSSRRASNNTEQFIHKEGRKKAPEELKSSSVKCHLFFIFMWARASVLCFLCAKLCEGSLCSESLGETVSGTGLVTVSGWDRCLLDVWRPVTRSRSPAWACAPRGCVEGRGKERVYTGNQPAMWGPIHPMRKTWTSRTHDWCPLVSQTCSGGSGTVQSWSRPHMCKGRLCSKSLQRRKREKNKSGTTATHFHLHWCIISPASH